MKMTVSELHYIFNVNFCTEIEAFREGLPVNDELSIIANETVKSVRIIKEVREHPYHSRTKLILEIEI